MKSNIATVALLSIFCGTGLAKEPENAATRQALEMIARQTGGTLCHRNDSSIGDRQKLILEIDGFKSSGFIDQVKMTPIDYAVLADDPKSIDRLIAIGYDLKKQYHNPLATAAMFNSPHAFVALLAHGVDPNASYPNNASTLLAAAIDNRQSMIKLLFNAGANPNPTWNHISALDYAMACKDQSLIDLLMANGVRPSNQTETLADKFGLSIKPKR
jgi:ankyrin repeat protein